MPMMVYCGPKALDAVVTKMKQRATKTARAHPLHNKTLKFIAFGFSALLAGPVPVLAQCAPGIPCAGNPGGIPPSAPNSPYNNHAGDYPTAGNSNASPRWRDSWGAVAMDDDSGAAGVAVNEESKPSANATAMKQCSMNGSAHCKVIISYYNQCVSVAQQHNGGFIIAAGRAEQADADRYTLSQCAKHGTCEIVYHACSYAVRVQ